MGSRQQTLVVASLASGPGRDSDSLVEEWQGKVVSEH